jgi:hypothetical protein
MTKPGPQNIELWCNGEMIGHGAAALESLPDTPAQREAADRMFRVEARAVEADERCDAALEEQRLAEAVVNQARMSLVRQLHERCDTLNGRLDKFERARARAHLDALPDPDYPNSDPATPNPDGELHSIGPTEHYDPGYFDPDDSADAHDQIPHRRILPAHLWRFTWRSKWQQR